MKFEPLHPKQHDRVSFDCGITELNTYLKRYANQDQKRRLTRVYVLADGVRIIGFYSLSAHSVPRDDLPKNFKLDGYGDLPFLLLDRLAAICNYPETSETSVMMLFLSRFWLHVRRKVSIVAHSVPPMFTQSVPCETCRKVSFTKPSIR